MQTAAKTQSLGRIVLPRRSVHLCGMDAPIVCAGTPKQQLQREGAQEDPQ
jgi:hypothetical protein